MKLEQRVALVTGSARRLGRAIALRLADSGMPLALHYHSSQTDAEQTAAQCRARGVAAELFACDLADSTATAALVPRVLERFGRLDVLVNNAARFTPQRLDDFTPAEWEQTLAINLTAPLLLSFAARDALRAARGRIVNLCDAATAHPAPGHLAYIVSKGALDTLTRVLARAFAPDVNVVGVAPGIAAFPPDYDAAKQARLTGQVPLRRVGTPEDIAALVHFLLESGDFITGAIVPVDGGRAIA